MVPRTFIPCQLLFILFVFLLLFLAFTGNSRAHQAFAEVHANMDGPELLEFAMILAKEALLKAQVC